MANVEFEFGRGHFHIKQGPEEEEKKDGSWSEKLDFTQKRGSFDGKISKQNVCFRKIWMGIYF